MDTNSSFMERYLTPIAIVVGAVIIAIAYAYGHGASTNTDTGAQPPAATVDIKDVETSGDPYIGDPNAPVTIAFWFDYQCPFCKQFDETVISQLDTAYVQTGKLRIVFKDFQFLGQDSLTAAEFARAMWELYPDKFYTWYQAMFAAQDDEGDQGFGDLATIVTVTKAQVPGVDTDKVTALMTSKKSAYDAAISEDRDEGASFGVNGTPAMIVGTSLLAGAQDYQTVAGLIDAELNK